ncbi:hypothetical protein J4416_00590 [Candidatus Pacearchaeota archaeon]|nr:hypothetical protein [Candidatus Pacearchaeota archaeon]
MKNPLNLFREKEIFLIGEIHGTKEIPHLCFKWINEIAKKYTVAVCLEIPIEYQINLARFFVDEAVNGGFATKEYYSMVQQLKKLGIKIYCINDFVKTQQQKENILAKNILEISKKEKKIIVIMGEVHASKKPFMWKNKKIFPAGYLINKIKGRKMVSIRVLPKSGRSFNQEIVHEKDDFFNSHFNYVYKINKVSPSQLP